MSTAPSMLSLDLGAQIPAVKFDIPAARGLLVSPVYEGWYKVGGTAYVLFGYYNKNLEEVLDIPVGPGNKVAPGPIDQGQPTRFSPGQHFGVFAVAVPNDPPRTEMTWTLTANGQTFSIPASLDPLYLVSPQRNDGGIFPGNTPPIVKFDPAGPSAQGPLGISVSRTATVSHPLTVDVWVADDAPSAPPGSDDRVPSVSSGRPQQRLAVNWKVYRGSGDIRFSNATPALEQGKASTTVTFSEAGDYILHVLAIDSRSATKCCWTNGYVRVAVEAGAPPGR